MDFQYGTTCNRLYVHEIKVTLLQTFCLPYLKKISKLGYGLDDQRIMVHFMEGVFSKESTLSGCTPPLVLMDQVWNGKGMKLITHLIHCGG